MTISELAAKKAVRSACRYKISALGFDKNGNLLGTSVNKPRFDKYKGGTHAEMALIKRYSDNIKTILICRVNNQGDFLAIKPCSTCARVANKMGIKIKTISEKI